MQRAMVLATWMLWACSGDGANEGGGDDGGTHDGGTHDSATRDGGPTDAANRPDGSPGAARAILYQCTAFDGGLCRMDRDGSNPTTLHGAGFAPRGLDDGSILFHTAAYRVARRTDTGAIEDLGDGAFPCPAPNGRIVFQCSGLGGGVCSMAADGSDRTTIRQAGRVPDVDTGGVLVFHSDAYRVIRRAAGGQETDLGDGAFPRWLDDGRILFQCSGLGGGLCRMNADGSNRTTLAASGRVPDADGDGDVVFHSDAYMVSLRTASGTTTLRAGANAVWW